MVIATRRGHNLRMQLHRGRLIDHVHLVVADFDACLRFYTAIFEVLGIPVVRQSPSVFFADELYVSTATSPDAAGELTGRQHLAFQAASHEVVQRFHAAALAAGGIDNGGPGERHYHPGYYAAFVKDPAGNNIEAAYHGPAKVSAASITIDF